MARSQNIESRIIPGANKGHREVIDEMSRGHAVGLIIGQRPVGSSDRLVGRALVLLAQHATDETFAVAINALGFARSPEVLLQALEARVACARVAALRPSHVSGKLRAKLFAAWIEGADRSDDVLQMIGEIPSAPGSNALHFDLRFCDMLDEIPLPEAVRIDRLIIETPYGLSHCAYLQTLTRSFRSNNIDRVTWHLDLLVERYGGRSGDGVKSRLSYYNRRVKFAAAFPDLDPQKRLEALQVIGTRFDPFGFDAADLIRRAKLSRAAHLNQSHENLHKIAHT